ncbi:MAG TPA: hypothetical protein VFS19_06570 [Planctomycetota bacterium]|nr:hypothetical protein [Planctomycetota bacterium]
MRTSLLLLAAVFVSASPALKVSAAHPSGPAPREGHDGKIDYIHDTEFGLAKAKLELRSAMLFFTADW